MPGWRRFHLVTYRLRMATVALLMVCSYTTVALSTQRGWQLVGVVFASLQVGRPVVVRAAAMVHCTPYAGMYKLASAALGLLLP